MNGIMKWTLERLEFLENEILKLYQTTELSSNTLADVMGKIDTERFKIKQVNDANTSDEKCTLHNVTKRISKTAVCNWCNRRYSKKDMYLLQENKGDRAIWLCDNCNLDKDIV